MDVETSLSLVSTAASAAVGGAATAAGQNAWQSLLTLARRATGRPGAEVLPRAGASADAGADAGPGVDPADEEAVRVLTGHLAQRAHDDGGFAEELCRWAEAHRAAIQVDRAAVHNTVSGSAKIDGPLIQARDIQGGINL